MQIKWLMLVMSFVLTLVLSGDVRAHSKTKGLAQVDNSELLFDSISLGATATVSSSDAGSTASTDDTPYYELGGDTEVTVQWSLNPAVPAYGDTVNICVLYTMWGAEDDTPAPIHGETETVTITGDVNGLSQAEGLFTITPPKRARRLYLRSTNSGSQAHTLSARVSGE